MSPLDLAIVFLYLLFATGVGIYASKRVGNSAEEYFVAGRTLPWWLAGSSMVATTFAADTPLAVTGLIASSGVAGNWLWWCVGIAHVIAALGFARLWRRLEVVTDAEIVAKRYGGPWAKRLRTITAGYQAIFINCLVMGWILVAMRKVSLALFPDLSADLVTYGLMLLAIGYATLGGMRSVVITDLVQLCLAFVGAIALAFFALEDVGGIRGLIDGLHTTYPDRADSLLSLVPHGDLPGLPFTLFALLLTMGWWKNAQGAGYIVQRLSACKSPEDAEKGSLFFAVVHNALRPWPWILVGLAGLLVWPLDGGSCAEGCTLPYSCIEGLCRVEDRESTYALLMVRYLPVGWLGIVVASMLAAFMSTIDTHVNWGASYLVNDLKIGRSGDEPSPLWHGRAGALALGILAAFLSNFMDAISDIWLIVIMLGGGIGSVWVGRWLWWRVNARVELVAMASATGLAMMVFIVQKQILFGLENPLFAGDIPKTTEIMIVSGGSLFSWVASAWVTRPEPMDTLVEFYQRVHPPAFGWKPVIEHLGSPAESRRSHRVLPRILAGLFAVYGTLFGMGNLLLGDTQTGWFILLPGLAAFLWLLRNPTPSENVSDTPSHSSTSASK